MSFEHEWPLTAWPTRGEVERALGETIATARLTSPEVSRMQWAGLIDDEDGDLDEHDLEDDADRAGFGVDGLDASLPPRTTIALVFRIPAAAAVDVAMRLDPTADRAETVTLLDPPHDGVDHYEVAIDLLAPDDAEALAPCVRIYSNEYDNRQAWPVLAALGGAFADRLEKLSAFS